MILSNNSEQIEGKQKSQHHKIHLWIIAFFAEICKPDHGVRQQTNVVQGLKVLHTTYKFPPSNEKRTPPAINRENPFHTFHMASAISVSSIMRAGPHVLRQGTAHS